MSPRTRRRTLVASGVLVAVLLVAASCGLALGAYGPRSIRHALDNGAMVSSDGRTVTVTALLTCFENHERATVTETVDEIRVLVASRHGIAPACEGEYTGMPVHLSQPWGGRRIVDAVTGREVTPLEEGKVLRPSVLPSGYRFGRDRLGHLLGYPCWQQEYHNGEALLYVDQCPSPPSTAGASSGLSDVNGLVVEGPRPVRATSGVLFRQTQYAERGLRWSEPGWDFSLLSEAYSGSGRALDDADLLAVANGLH